ncbi:MAG TPA: hypothetical protein VFA76_13155 [Terriglobales bacterium]|nr:hypothetical protein [Terriglobales bacterium]
MPRTAIISALEREVRGAIGDWRIVRRDHGGRRFRFYENDQAVLVCAGIGPEAARRACEAIIVLYQPEMVISAGFAGALDPALKVGDSFIPRSIVDVSDGSTVEINAGDGVLLSLGSVAGAEQKRKLAQVYSAQAIDMEAAAVARGAQARGVRFAAYKVISDELDFELPELDRFITSEGRFRTASFVFFAGLRPWLWSNFVRLKVNSDKAAESLCQWLEQYNRPAERNNIRTSGVYQSGQSRVVGSTK